MTARDQRARRLDQHRSSSQRPGGDSITRATSCSGVVGRLWDYLDDAISPGDREGVDTHLLLCRTCRGQLQFAEGPGRCSGSRQRRRSPHRSRPVSSASWMLSRRCSNPGERSSVIDRGIETRCSVVAWTREPHRQDWIQGDSSPRSTVRRADGSLRRLVRGPSWPRRLQDRGGLPAAPDRCPSSPRPRGRRGDRAIRSIAGDRVRRRSVEPDAGACSDERDPDRSGLGEHLPFRSSSFGAVLVAFTICFVRDPALVLTEISRVLICGGGLVIGFLPRGTVWADMYVRRGAEGHPIYKGARFDTAGQVEGLIEGAGLRITGYLSTLLQPPGPETYSIEDPAEGYRAHASFIAVAATGGS